MLKSWSIENFKPIVNSGELKLAPVTVLAGRNSSGKSSLLQSILMIAQTLSSKVADRPLLPTGLNVQLGTFEDILNIHSASRILRVGFELDFESEQIPLSKRKPYIAEDETSINAVRANATFNSASSTTNSPSAIEAAKVAVENVFLEINATQISFIELDDELDDNSFGLERSALDIKFSFMINKLSENQRQHFLQNVGPDYLRFVPYSGEQPNYIGNFEYPNKKNQETVLVALSHFLPGRLVRKFKEEERRLHSLRTFLRRLISRYLGRFDDEDLLTDYIQPYPNLFNPDADISEDLRESIQKFCEDHKIMIKFSGQNIFQVIIWANSLMKTIRHNSDKRLTVRERKDKTILINELEKLLFQTILKTELESHKEAEGLEILVNDDEVENLSQSVTKLTLFFTSKIRYLGPLRADPQASQKFSPSSELDDVGAKGEYAAAVYDANQNAIINWYNPHNKRMEASALKVALDNWVRYLGIANQVKIEAAGQSGFSWWVVSKEDDVAFPLSAVGVGVSQILPILVMGLLSPTGTLLIVEQPELHLHPSVQARLGDFFIGLSKCKKQCLIETHSENLVSQLRYHIVQAGGIENSDCMIYFVDRDEKGAAIFEQVEISPNGNILNWPDGFFDETMLQEDRITAASLRKRAHKVKNG